MKVWSDLVYDTAIAKTGGTFDAINSNQSQVKIANPTAKSILGFLVNYAQTVATDAEVTPDLILRVTSKALGISSQDIIIGAGSNDQDAVSKYTPRVTRFVPFRNPSGINTIFNADISFEASASVTNTGGLDVVVAVVYSDAEPDGQFAMELMAQLHKRVTGGAYAVDAAKAHGTGGSAVTLSSISIPTGATQLCGLYAKILPNGISAGDPISGFMEFQASGIPDFSPQKWPLCVFGDAALGTVVQGKVGNWEGHYYPTRFQLTGAETTVNVSSTLIIAAGTAPDTIQGLLYE